MTTSVRKSLEFSVLVMTTIKSTETSNWDETQTECMYFIAKVRIKMHAFSSCFISELLVSVLLL